MEHCIGEVFLESARVTKRGIFNTSAAGAESFFDNFSHSATITELGFVPVPRPFPFHQFGLSINFSCGAGGERPCECHSLDASPIGKRFKVMLIEVDNAEPSDNATGRAS